MLVIIPFVAGLILLVVALAVRFAGNAHILNVVNYAQVADVAALHRWAGNKLLVLPLLSVVIGLVSLRSPSLAFPLVFVLATAIVAVAIWVAVGSARFGVGR